MASNLKQNKATALPLFILVWLVIMTIGPVMLMAGNNPHLPCDNNEYAGSGVSENLVNVPLSSDQILFDALGGAEARLFNNFAVFGRQEDIFTLTSTFRLVA